MPTPLEESIAHWERMRDFTSLDQFNTENTGGFYCALCDAHPACIDCPVMKRTDESNCRGTPYRHAVEVRSDLDFGIASWDDWREATQAEIDFLRSLLP